jgi:hypothetical protein
MMDLQTGTAAGSAQPGDCLQPAGEGVTYG